MPTLLIIPWLAWWRRMTYVHTTLSALVRSSYYLVPLHAAAARNGCLYVANNTADLIWEQILLFINRKLFLCGSKWNENIACEYS